MEGRKKMGKKTYEQDHSNGWRNAGKLRKISTSIRGIPTTPKIVKMIITTWNIRGLNSRGKQRYLKGRLKRDKPNIMIVQETKIREQKLKDIMRKFKPHYEITGQDAIGSAGGLAILWNPEEIQFESWVSVPRILSIKFRNIG